MCNQPFFALYIPVREIHEDFPLKEGTVRVPLPFSRNRLENHTHNLGKALGEGLGLLYPFLSLFLSLSPSLTLYLSLLSQPPSLYLSFYLSFSISPSLCLLSIILFGVSNGRFRPCYYSASFDFSISYLQEIYLPKWAENLLLKRAQDVSLHTVPVPFIFLSMNNNILIQDLRYFQDGWYFSLYLM